MSTAENINLKQQMAIQSANVYKGKVCCYASVTKRDLKKAILHLQCRRHQMYVLTFLMQHLQRV